MRQTAAEKRSGAAESRQGAPRVVAAATI
jgi:hypothetical protein